MLDTEYWISENQALSSIQHQVSGIKSSTNNYTFNLLINIILEGFRCIRSIVVGRARSASPLCDAGYEKQISNECCTIIY